MKSVIVTCLSFLCVMSLGCVNTEAGLPAPGLDGDAPRFFFPISLEVSADGSRLYVANANFDRAFRSGSLISLPTASFDVAAADASRRSATLPADSTVGRLDSFAGMMRVNASATALYVVTRDNDLLSRVALDAAGLPVCGDEGCSADSVDLGLQDLSDPFSLVLANLVMPGATTQEPVVLVSHLAPVRAGSGAAAKNARLAVIPERLVSVNAEPFKNGAYTVDIGAPASSSLVFSDSSRKLYIGGCFQRVSADQVIACGLNQDSAYFRVNPLRSLVVEAGTPVVEQASLGFTVGGGDTTDLAIGSDSRLLYVATARPSALLVLEKVDGVMPTTRAIVPLAQVPNRIHVLRRATGDLVVVSATQSNALLVVDPAAGQVVAQLSSIGKGPYGMTSRATADGDRVYVSLFNDCAVAAVDVPAARPDQSSVAAVIGGCP